MKAYEKQSLMVKTVVNIADNQELELSLTKNESDNILYPSSPMDAVYDDSNLYTLSYEKRDMGGRMDKSTKSTVWQKQMETKLERLGNQAVGIVSRTIRKTFAD